MALQLVHVEKDQLERLHTATASAFCACKLDIGLELGNRVFNCPRQQGHVFVGTFDVVERSLGVMAHLRTSADVQTDPRIGDTDRTVNEL